MSDENPFLDEMRRDPENKYSRLIYADWLEERGDPRAPLNRLVCSDATWYCGHDLRKSALDAMHFAWSTQVRISVAHEFYVADASDVFHQFAIWIARQMLDIQPEAAQHADYPHFQTLLETKEAWLKSRRRRSSGLQQMIEQNRSNQVPAFTAIRLAANTTALSAAKYTSRFAQRSRLDVVSLPRQDFQLTQMLIDQCRWRHER